MPEIKLHVLPPSHPCHAVQAALRFKGLEYEKAVVDMRGHNAEMEAIYGAGNGTVPGMTIDGEPVHGSVAIMERLEALAPDPTLYPEPIADAVREAERWGDGDLQDLGRRLPWGALRFRPDAMGVLAGGGQLDPAGIDYAIRFVDAGWKYHGISAVRLHEDLQRLPSLLDHVDSLVESGVIGGEQPNAADFQIGATLRVYRTVGDLAPLLEGRPGMVRVADAFFRVPDGPGIPAGAYPAGWVPT